MAVESGLMSHCPSCFARFILRCSFCGLLTVVWCFLADSTAWASSWSFNKKEVPKTKADLLDIQNALVGHLGQAREATVSIRLEEGFGSGVIVSADGLILSAAHVTGGVDKELTVILNDGTELKAVSMGLQSETDAAMLRITEEGQYPHVDLNRDDDYLQGHWVFALGHSGGFDKERGPVLRLGRIVMNSRTTLHTDCKVIGGDSGGPLFDMSGKLIGIHSRVSHTVEQNMHVPIREYLDHWKDLESGEFIGDGAFAKRPERGSGFLGFGCEDTDDGLLVGKVLENGAAANAGIEAGDIVLELEGEKISKRAQLESILREKASGDEVEIVILRDGARKVLKVTLDGK